ncbi:MAG: type II secretion system protein GspG [Planctomycetes bacterium]|nr:type II secretion system protein GspG [Planctomycetota bacterium]
MISLVFLACLAQDPLGEDVDKAIANLYSDRHSESDLAKQELVEIGRKSVPKLLAELEKPREAEKTKQIRARRLICEILGHVRDNSQPVLDALTARLTDTEEYGWSIAAAAAGALDMIADERAVPSLITALTSKQAESDKWLKYHCIHALGVMRTASAAEALRKALDDEGVAQVAGENVHLISAAAADALGRIRDKDAQEGLGKLLSKNDKNPYTDQTVAVHAARALERIAGESKGPLEGDQGGITATLDQWRTWWAAEKTKKDVATTRRRIEEVAAALETYKRDQGKYPDILLHLKEKPAVVTGTWPEGGYYKGEIVDAWGTPFVYDTTGDDGAAVDVVSRGNDRRDWGKGDDADLWNHDRWKTVRLEKSRKAMDAILVALKNCNEAQGRYPDALAHLTGKTAPAGFTTQKEWPKEGYLTALPTDGFGQTFSYTRPGKYLEPFDLVSWGADLAEGGADENADLWNHDKWKAPRVEETKKKMDAVAKAIEFFRKEQDRYPAQLADLAKKPPYAKKDKWPAEGYVKDIPDRDAVQDAFKNPFVYRVPGTAGEAFDLISLGADGREGGAGPDADMPLKK